MRSLLVGLTLFFLSYDALSKPLKVLHVTLHDGCKKEFEEVAKELGIEVTSWFVQELEHRTKYKGFWEGSFTGNEIYNVGPRRAKRVWDRHKDFFNEFDVVITSDTAPLSRIFLQNGWQKPLIIWVCNRFDYAHGSGGEDRFPDRAYYDLIRKTADMENVRVISYTPYEHVYAQRKGVNWGEPHTIKPIGIPEKHIENLKSGVPDSINQSETLFVFPRLAAGQINRVKSECLQRGVKTWSGVYNGPEDLKRFKGVLFFPYAFSNLALFEDIQRGMVHFVPTQRFLNQLGFVRGGMGGNLQHCEWYFDEYKDLMVFFDSWQELKEKVETTDYEALRIKNREFGKQHREKMLNGWVDVFNEFIQ